MCFSFVQERINEHAVVENSEPEIIPPLNVIISNRSGPYVFHALSRNKRKAVSGLDLQILGGKTSHFMVSVTVSAVGFSVNEICLTNEVTLSH